MDDQLKQMFEKYIELKAKESEIAEAIEELKPTLTTVVDERGGKFDYNGFSFSVSYRKKYEYNKRILDMEEELKKQKKDFEKNSEPAGATPVFSCKPKKEPLPVWHLKIGWKNWKRLKKAKIGYALS